MYFVASDVLFGAPAYLHVEGEKLDATKARASASLPGVSTMVEIDGHRYLDGGTTDSIPFAVAMGLDGAPEVSGAEPADRALVVLTQDRTYIKDGATERAILRTHRYDVYPYYRASACHACRPLQRAARGACRPRGRGPRTGALAARASDDSHVRAQRRAAFATLPAGAPGGDEPPRGDSRVSVGGRGARDGCVTRRTGSFSLVKIVWEKSSVNRTSVAVYF